MAIAVRALVALVALAGSLGAAATAHAAKAPAKVLIVTVNDGKRSKLAPLAEKRLVAAAKSEGVRAVRIRTRKQLTVKAVRGAAAVVFAAGQGTILSGAVEEALNERVRAGAGVAFFGDALGLQPKSPDFSTLLGARPAGADAPQSAEVQFVDKLHPATAQLPRRWRMTAPWTKLEKSPVGRVHVLGWVDERSYKPAEKFAMGIEHPVTWCRELVDGRSFTTTIGTTRRIWNSRVFRTQLAGAIAYAAGRRTSDCGATVWSNWKRSVIDTDITDGTQLDVGPDGRVYYIEHTGSTLKIYDPAIDGVREAGYIPSTPGLGQGLLGLAVDVNFVKTRWIYMYYHVGLLGRLSRFTLGADDKLDPVSEKVLLTIQNTGVDHNGGGLAMQSNGDLYLAIGANDMPHFDGQYGSRNPTPVVGAATQTDSEITTQNTLSLLGKVLRIHPEPDGTYTIPKGNMFPPGTPDGLPEIFTMGHRNAFHVKVDDLTGQVLEGDVGPDGREDDPERGPRGYDEFNVLTGPANYGWPYCIGPNLPYNDINSMTGEGTGKPFDCNRLVNRSGPGIKELGPASKPLIWYPYGDGADTAFPEMSEAWAGGTDGGRLAIPGPRYRPFPGSRMPLFYDNSWFIADWTRNWIKQVILDEKGDVLRIQRFAPDRGVQAPIDMDIGADGSLYVIEWGGQTIPFGNPLAAKVARYQYVPRCGTCDPTVVSDQGGGGAVGTEGNVIAGPLAQTAGFLTTSVTIAKGSPLTFSNLDAVPHNVTSKAVTEDGRRLFSAPNIATGTTTVDGADKLATGSYEFVCSVHPSMVGTLEVR